MKHVNNQAPIPFSLTGRIHEQIVRLAEFIKSTHMAGKIHQVRPQFFTGVLNQGAVTIYVTKYINPISERPKSSYVSVIIHQV